MKYDEICLIYVLFLFEVNFNMRGGKVDIIKNDCEGII